jgi:mandelate racemase
MALPRLTMRAAELRSVSIPLKRPVVSKVGLFDRWPLILINLHTEEGLVGRSYLEPYLERSVRYLVPAIRDLAGARTGRPTAPLDDFRIGRAGLNLIGLEGVSMIAVSGLDMAAWDALAKAAGLPLAIFLGGDRREP